MKLSERNLSYLCIIILALLPFVVFWELTLSHEIMIAGDISTYYYPFQYVVAQQMRAGHLPLWNSRIFGGVSWLAESQGVLYPLNLLFSLAPIWMSINYSFLLHLSLAGVFMYLFMRSLDVGPGGALVAGVTFMFCGFIMAHLGHLSMVRTVPWLPLVLWAFERWRKRRDVNYIGAGALAIGLLLLAVHPQIAVYALGVTGAYIAYFLLFSDNPKLRWKIALGSSVMIGLGILLALPQVLGFYEASQFYGRSSGAVEGYEMFASSSLPPIYLLHMIFPRLFPKDLNATEMIGYIGILPWPLAFVAVFRWKHKAKYFFLIVLGISLLLVLGKYTPLYPLMYHVPIYNKFRVPPRNWFEFDFAVAVLAGAGFDYLASEQIRVARRVLCYLAAGLVVIAILIIGVALGLLRFSPNLIQPTLARNGISAWTSSAVLLPLGLIVASAVVLVVVSFCSLRRYSVVLFAALIVVDLHYSFADHHLAAHSTREPLSEIFGDRPSVVGFLKQDTSLYRVLTYSPNAVLGPYEKLRNIMSPNLNILFDIDSVDGYGSLILSQYSAFSNYTLSGSGSLFITHPRLFRPDHHNIRNLMNLKYILIPVNLDMDPIWPLYVKDGIIFETFPYKPLELGSSSELLSTTLDLPTHPVTTLGIVSSLGNCLNIVDNQPVARLTVTDQDDHTSVHYLVAGRDTSDAAYDCNPAAMQHAKSTVAYSVPGDSSACSHQVYFARLELRTEPTVLRSLELAYLPENGKIEITRLSLYNIETGKSYPFSVAQGYLRYFSKGDAYQKVYEDERLRVYENTRVLPRTFLVPEVDLVSDADEAVRVVRQDVTFAGEDFDPRELALIDMDVSLPPPPGSAITLYAYPIQSDAWTVVQWQDAQGDWHDVEGWQGPLGQEGHVVWWVTPEIWGEGPFRWAIYQRQDGQLLATSDSFNLPGSADEAVKIVMPLLWPDDGPSRNENRSVRDVMRSSVISSRSGRMEVAVTASQDAFLVYSENYYPGWRATVDGKPVTVYRTDGTLLGVPVPAGEHRVIFEFKPLGRDLLIGSFVALFASIGLILNVPRRYFRPNDVG
jgi:hypothetical protein